MTKSIGTPFGYRINDRGEESTNADEWGALVSMIEWETSGMRPGGGINLLGAFNVAQAVQAEGHVNRNGKPYSEASVRRLLKKHGFMGDCECQPCADARPVVRLAKVSEPADDCTQSEEWQELMRIHNRQSEHQRAIDDAVRERGGSNIESAVIGSIVIGG